MALGTKDLLSLSDEHDSDRSLQLNMLLVVIVQNSQQPAQGPSLCHCCETLQFSANNSSRLPVAQHPSSLCCLPSTPQHKRRRWQQQTGKTCAGVCCRHRRTSTSSGSRAGSDPSCRLHLCWLTSPVYCPDELLSICRRSEEHTSELQSHI